MLKKLCKELLVAVASACLSMAVPFNLIAFGIVKTPSVAFGLMFMIYAHSYLFLKRIFLKRCLMIRFFEFEIVTGFLTAYMVLAMPYMQDKPDFIAFPSCYWTFIFISIYVSTRNNNTGRTIKVVNDKEIPTVEL